MNHNKYIDLLLEDKILTAKVKNIKPGTNALMYASEPYGNEISFTNEMVRYIGKEIKVRPTETYPDWYRIIKPTGYAFYFHKSWLDFHSQQQQTKLEF